MTKTHNTPEYDCPSVERLVNAVTDCTWSDPVTCPLTDRLSLRYWCRVEHRSQVGPSDWSVNLVAAAAVYLGDREVCSKSLPYRESDPEAIRAEIRSLEGRARKLLAEEAKQRAAQLRAAIPAAWDRLGRAGLPTGSFDPAVPGVIADAVRAGISRSAIRSFLIAIHTTWALPDPAPLVENWLERAEKLLAPEVDDDDLVDDGWDGWVMSSAEFAAYRSLLGLTYAEVADRLGVRLTTVQDWESGRRGARPSEGPASEVRRMAKEQQALVEEWAADDEPIEIQRDAEDRGWQIAAAGRVLLADSKREVKWS